MDECDQTSCRYVFVCGLHRSGTTLLGRNIGRLADCTGFKNTPRFMGGEGQLLQEVYPIDTEFGGAGRFGFDSRAHMTETSELLTPYNIARLRASWHSYWDRNKKIFVEKTPGNLLMTRFLQAVFPNSYFIVIKRHPVAVSLATQKLKAPGIIWKVKKASLHYLFEHWLHCHDIFERDREHLKHLYELTYEDYIRSPEKYHKEIAAFIGTRLEEDLMEKTTGAHNKKYFERWSHLLRNSPFKAYYQYLVQKYERRFAKHNYSLMDGCGMSSELFKAKGQISDFTGKLCCIWVDVCVFFSRFATFSPKEQIKQLLPEFVLGKVRRVRQRASLRKRTENTIFPC